MLGWDNARSTVTSRVDVRRTSSTSGSAELILNSFTATISPLTRSRHRITTPYAPSPTVRKTSKSSLRTRLLPSSSASNPSPPSSSPSGLLVWMGPSPPNVCVSSLTPPSISRRSSSALFCSSAAARAARSDNTAFAETTAGSSTATPSASARRTAPSTETSRAPSSTTAQMR